MGRYIAKRFLAMMVTLFVIMTLAFFIVRLMPGNVFDDPNLSDEAIAALEEKAHLNEPIIVQYVYYLKEAFLEGNWGVSVKIRPGVPVFDVIKDRIPVTMALNLTALAVSVPLGIVAGTFAALYKSKLPDHIISVLVVICISVPSFVFASLLQYFVAGKASMFPIIYQSTAGTLQKALSMVLPVMALSFSPIATICRYLRGELMETLTSEFMLLARTKGLSMKAAIVRHAFRNSCVPLANVVIPMFANIMGGSLVVEKIFSVPGIGGIVVDSINISDHPMTMAALIFYSIISLITILIVDISYGIIDPRIRLGDKSNG